MKYYKVQERWYATKNFLWPPTEDQEEEIQMEEKLTKSFSIEVLAYSIFFVSTITMATRTRDDKTFSFNNALKDLMFSRSIELVEGFRVPYQDLVTVQEFWAYFGDQLLPSLYANAKYDVNEYGMKTFSNNTFMGAPRLRQLRVRKGSCFVHPDYQGVFDNCYSTYHKHTEETVEDYHGVKYQSRWQLQSNVFHGEIGTYYGGGYVIPLTHNLTKNRELFQELKRINWVDRGTRLVLFEFSLVNKRVRLLANIKAAAEFAPTGGFVNSYQIKTVRFFSSFSDAHFETKFIVFIIFLLSLTLTSAKVHKLISSIGFKRYFRNPWNSVNLWICLILWPCVFYEYWHLYYVKMLESRQKPNYSKYINTDRLVFANTIYLYLFAVSALMLGIKFLKYLSMTEAIYQFTATLSQCWKKIFGLFLIYIVMLAAYTHMGQLLFGEYIKDFRDFEHSAFSILNAMIGEYDYRRVEAKFPITSSIFFVTFTILLFFICFNIFLAVVTITYNEVTEAKIHGTLSVWRYFALLKNRWLLPPIMMCVRRFKKITPQRRNTIAKMVATDGPQEVPADDYDDDFFEYNTENELRLIKIQYRNEKLNQLMENANVTLKCLGQVNYAMNHLLKKIVEKQMIYDLTHHKKIFG